MPDKKDQDTEARRKEAQRAHIQVRGLTGVVDLPKNVIATELLARIKKGIFQPGDPFPSIAVIMEITEPNVAKNTARAALDQLRNRGYIKTLTGYGTFVNPQDLWEKEQDK